jgi:hypothetical protein
MDGSIVSSVEVSLRFARLVFTSIGVARLRTARSLQASSNPSALALTKGRIDGFLPMITFRSALSPTASHFEGNGTLSLARETRVL